MTTEIPRLRINRITKKEFHELSLEWEPEGWWTEIGLPEFKRTQWLEYEGNYLEWRKNKWRKAALWAIEPRFRERRERQKPGEKSLRPPREKNSRRREALLAYHLEKELRKRKITE